MILGEGLFILRREIVCEVGMAQYGINKQKTGTIITDLKLKPFTEMRLKFLGHLYLSTNL